ncbi:MAG: polysaccharide deacetylase family protein [Bacteroidaceae bacterium]|nr:polysaccharide deacetylase family protein [Bacteroidaceae bacterium]
MKRTILTLISILTITMMTYAQEKLVALSFDDGPNTETTVHMLDVLKKHGVKASFFVIGKNINEESAKVMQRAYNEGHDIENHSLTHCAMPTLSADSIRSEISQTSALVEKYVGEKPQFFRPPYIALNRTMFDNIDLPFISGEGCNDWEDSVSADERVERMLGFARDGLIFLLHDMPGNEQTVEAVDRIIPILKERGYRFVTVRTLFKEKNIATQRGIIYTDILNAKPWE